jgi:hypothetical protein
MHKQKTTPICEKSQLGVVFSVFVIQIGFILKNHVLRRKKVKKLTDKLQKFLFAIHKK